MIGSQLIGNKHYTTNVTNMTNIGIDNSLKKFSETNEDDAYKSNILLDLNFLK